MLKGEKHFCDAEGKQASSPKDAQLLLSKGQKIVKDPTDGRCHLLAANEDLHSIKNSADAHAKLHTTHAQYQKALNDNATVHAKVDRNKQIQEEHYLQRHSAALAQKKTLQGNIALLSDKKSQLEASQREVQKKLERSNQSRLSAPNESLPLNTKPTLRPEPQIRSGNLQKPNDELTIAIKRLKDDHSPEAIKRVSDLAKPYANHPHFQSFSNQIEMIKNMPRFAPISKIPMDTLLRTSGYFGVSVEKPNVTPLSAATLAKTPDNALQNNVPDTNNVPQENISEENQSKENLSYTTPKPKPFGF